MLFQSGWTLLLQTCQNFQWPNTVKAGVSPSHSSAGLCSSAPPHTLGDTESLCLVTPPAPMAWNPSLGPLIQLTEKKWARTWRLCRRSPWARQGWRWYPAIHVHWPDPSHVVLLSAADLPEKSCGQEEQEGRVTLTATVLHCSYPCVGWISSLLLN